MIPETFFVPLDIFGYRSFELETSGKNRKRRFNEKSQK